MNHNKRKFRGVLSGFMATALTASLLPLPEAKASAYFNVINQDWYRDAVTRWATYGVVSGKLDNEFKPDDPIKRGEMAIMLDQVMGYEKTSDNLFTDLLDPTQWYFTALQKANAAGFMDGLTTTTMGPEASVTREAAAQMLYKAFHLDDGEPSTATNTTFADNGSITYGKEAVIKLVELGVITGRDDNLFEPFANVTRAEFCVMLNKMVSTFQKTATTSSVSPTSTGTYVVRSGEVNLTNMTIPGDLILAEGISEGDVTLNNVTIGGNLYVQGGGVESIYLNDVTLEGNLQVDRQMAPVRVVFGGKTQAPEVSVKNSCILDASTLGTDGLVGDVVVSNAETVTLLGTISSLTNKCVGTEYTINEANIAEIHFESSGIINGVAVAAGSSFDSNSIPNVDLTEPEITLYHDYGSAEEDEDNVPYAESTVSSLTFDQSTGEVVATIQVINEEDCVLMSEAKNAITVYNPNNLASLDALELDITKKTTTNTTEFTVTFTMTQNYSEVPLSVNFKDENATPEVTVEANYNGISSASANLEVVEVSMSGTGTVTANLEIDSIKFCEPHYLDEYGLTTETDIEFTVESDYDADESTAEYEIQFDSSEVDSIHFTVNFLKIDAQEEIPKIYTTVYDEEESKANGSSVDVEDLFINTQGMVQVELKLSLSQNYMVLSNLSKAITILADSDEPEYGYGLDFDVSVKHEGYYSYYTITFVPDSDIEEVCFVVNVEDASENLPSMDVVSNMVRMDDVEEYFVINQNTRTYSKTYVSVQVSVDEEALLEKYEGFVLDNSDLFTVRYYDSNEGSWAESSDFSFSKVEDGLYEIKFKPQSYTTEEDGEEVVKLFSHFLQLNLEQDDDFVALVPVDSNFEYSYAPKINLPYAVEATANTVTEGIYEPYSYQISFKVAITEPDPAITQPKYPSGSVDDGDYLEDDSTLNPLDQDSGNDYAVKYTDVTAGSSYQQVTIYFNTAFRCDPEDVVFYVGGVSAEDLVPDTEEDEDEDETAESYTAPTVTAKVGDTEYTGNVVMSDGDDGKGTATITLSDGAFYQPPTLATFTGTASLDGTISYDISTRVVTIPFKLAATDTESTISINIVTMNVSLAQEIKTVNGDDSASSYDLTFSNYIYDSTNSATPYSVDVTIPEIFDYTVESLTYKVGIAAESTNQYVSNTDTYTVEFDASGDVAATFTLTLAEAAPVLTAESFTDTYTIGTGSEFYGNTVPFTLTEPEPTPVTEDAADFTFNVERESDSQLVWEYAMTHEDEKIHFETDVTAKLTSAGGTQTLYFEEVISTEPVTSADWTILSTSAPLTVDYGETKTYKLSYNKDGTNSVIVELVGFGDTEPAEDDIFLFTEDAFNSGTAEDPVSAMGEYHNTVKSAAQTEGFKNFMITEECAELSLDAVMKILTDETLYIYSQTLKYGENITFTVKFQNNSQLYVENGASESPEWYKQTLSGAISVATFYNDEDDFILSELTECNSDWSEITPTTP